MDVILVFTGILQRMYFLKYLVETDINVLIDNSNPNYNKKAASSSPSPQTITNKPSYYSTNKKSWYTTTTNPKPKMSNSFELLQGSIVDIQKKYEILSDIISEANGKVHGSQRNRDPKTGLLDLLVYYEIPKDQRELVKQRFYYE